MKFLIAAFVLFTCLLLAAQGSAASSDSIRSWLKANGLEKYDSEFRDNDITLEVLPYLTDADLEEIGIRSIGDRKKILKAINDSSNINIKNTSKNIEGNNTSDTTEDNSVKTVVGDEVCTRPQLPNIVDLAQIPERVRKDIGRHIDLPLAKMYRSRLITKVNQKGPNWDTLTEHLYSDPPYVIYRQTEDGNSKISIDLGISNMSIKATGDHGWSREHIDFRDFKYIEPEADVVIDGISSRDVSFSYTWEMAIYEGSSGGRANRSFTTKFWIVGEKDVKIEINGEVFRLKGFEYKTKLINQGQVYVSEAEGTYVPHLGANVEFHRTKERWSGGSKKYPPSKYYNFKTTPEAVVYLRCIEKQGVLVSPILEDSIDTLD